MASSPRPFPVGNLFDYLAGTWQVQRTLVDRAAGISGSFTGTASFEDDGEGLREREEGRIQWPGHSGTATRAYLLRQGDGPAEANVLFPDGRPFHVINLQDGCWHARHFCSPDSYEVDYRVLSADCFEFTWNVTGPRKDLLLSSVLTRLGSVR